MNKLGSNADWIRWGKYDPLWAVAAWNGKEKEGASPWTDEEFYALGESDWRDFSHHWEHYGLNTSSCLEIGCGAGRLTRQLAAVFDRVYAVDVSADMINCARKNVNSMNVEFSVTDGIHVPLADCSVQAIFSTHVLQHLDSVQVGLMYFREFHRVLAEGGTLMVHLPVYEFPGNGTEVQSLFRMIWTCHRALGLARAAAKRWAGMRTMRGTPYPIGTLTRFMADLGFKNIEFRIFSAKINGGIHPFVFARK